MTLEDKVHAFRRYTLSVCVSCNELKSLATSARPVVKLGSRERCTTGGRSDSLATVSMDSIHEGPQRALDGQCSWTRPRSGGSWRWRLHGRRGDRSG